MKSIVQLRGVIEDRDNLAYRKQDHLPEYRIWNIALPEPVCFCSGLVGVDDLHPC